MKILKKLILRLVTPYAARHAPVDLKLTNHENQNETRTINFRAGLLLSGVVSFLCY